MRHAPITLTTGSLPRNILRFSIPLVFSNLLQVLFTMSDIAVVGRFAGAAALGSVGSCTILVSLFTGLLIGMGGGINTVTARYLGAGDPDRVEKAVGSSFVISLAYGLSIMALGLYFVPGVLRLMRTKDELLPGAILYMQVYLLGTPAMALYNYGSGVLSASGDSRRPLYYLLTAGVLNVTLNLFLVIVCRLGVLGVALASAGSQYVSAVLVLQRLLRCGESYALRPRQLKLDGYITRLVLTMGIPSGIQNAIFALASLFVQSAVNSFDTIMVEGNSAAVNSDALVYDTMAAFYVACATFIAQNYGAGNMDRVKKSYHICLAYSFGIAAILCTMLLLFGRQFLGLFTSEQPVIEAGLYRLTIMACSYSMSAFMDCTIAACRGLGSTVMPTFIVIMGSCVFRIIWICTVFAWFQTITSLYLLYICSWVLTSFFEILWFRKVYRNRLSGLTAAL